MKVEEQYVFQNCQNKIFKKTPYMATSNTTWHGGSG